MAIGNILGTKMTGVEEMTKEEFEKFMIDTMVKNCVYVDDLSEEGTYYVNNLSEEKYKPTDKFKLKIFVENNSNIKIQIINMNEINGILESMENCYLSVETLKKNFQKDLDVIAKLVTKIEREFIFEVLNIEKLEKLKYYLQYQIEKIKRPFYIQSDEIDSLYFDNWEVVSDTEWLL